MGVNKRIKQDCITRGNNPPFVLRPPIHTWRK